MARPALRLWSLAALVALQVVSRPSAGTAAEAVPDDFPRFLVPGRQAQMASLRRLFWLHYRPAGPLIPLWDEWMSISTLWPARGPEDAPSPAMRRRWAAALAARRINQEGYVHSQQHDGLAHAEGWPFPAWTQAGGIGWHFRGTGVPGYDAPLVTPDHWSRRGAIGTEVGPKGWELELTRPMARIETPRFAVAARVAPWLRLNWWAAGLDRARCYVEWTTADAPDYNSRRRVYFSPPPTAPADPPGDTPRGAVDTRGAETRTMIAVYRSPEWKGTITGIRIGFGNRGPAKLVIKSLHTACDTRHNINNSNFIRGCHAYVRWTGDLPFLQSQIVRLRRAMRFMMREFDTRRRRCVYTTWPGHEGRSGVRVEQGKKTILPGEGIGSNYWDLLPFGGEDALATIYYYDALHKLADLEQQVADHPQWHLAGGPDAFDPVDLRRHAQQVRQYGGKRFWNEQTGRFATVDLDGHLHDYGFTFLNNEAVYYGFATPRQASSIHAWLAGTRTIAGDTSQGPDIYHWRFGPRSTTRRNIDYYMWAWSSPESIPYGNQVQDGGSVLGFSYHDLMARLRTAGPGDAARRLEAICRWFDETQAAGGYRAYYRDRARGTLQGGNVPGGLGIDREFFESILVPQVMLYGFLGFQPTASGCRIAPRLPSDWPSLTITRIHLQDHVLDVTAKGRTIDVIDHRSGGGRPIEMEAPPGWTVRVSRPASRGQLRKGR